MGCGSVVEHLAALDRAHKPCTQAGAHGMSWWNYISKASKQLPPPTFHQIGKTPKTVHVLEAVRHWYFPSSSGHGINLISQGTASTIPPPTLDTARMSKLLLTEGNYTCSSHQAENLCNFVWAWFTATQKINMGLCCHLAVK